MWFVLNGERVDVPVDGEAVTTTTTLLQWLRASGRTGTKEGCAEGDCGACSVVIRDPQAASGAGWRVVNACLVLLPMVNGVELRTVEGLARGGSLHPAQDAMVRALGSQCGYCTPGFVMSLAEAALRTDLDAAWKRDDQLCGNLCRCTGYRPIRDALDATVAGGPGAPLPEPAHPLDAGSVAIAAAGRAFHAPATLAEAVAILRDAPQTRIVCGGTDLGLDVTQRHAVFGALLSVERVGELRGITVDGAGRIRIGAATPLTDVEAWSERGPLAARLVHRMLRYFGSRQIKHRATFGGNLCTASPIGDLAPVLLALDAELIAIGPDGERSVPIGAWFTGYRATALRAGELLARIEIPPLPDGARVGAYKVSRRRELDISAVAAGMRVDVGPDGVVTAARLAFGGMAATPVRAQGAEAALIGQTWTGGGAVAAAEAAANVVARELAPMSDHRGAAWFRTAVASNLVRGFAAETGEAAFAALPERHASTVIAS